MNTIWMNKIEGWVYKSFQYTKYILAFVWVFKIVFYGSPGGDDGGGGL